MRYRIPFSIVVGAVVSAGLVKVGYQIADAYSVRELSGTFTETLIVLILFSIAIICAAVFTIIYIIKNL